MQTSSQMVQMFAVRKNCTQGRRICFNTGGDTLEPWGPLGAMPSPETLTVKHIIQKKEREKSKKEK